MNPIANELNEIIKKYNPTIFELLSRFGKEIYFPRGILFQGAEAKKQAYKYNATIGIATEKGEPMHLKSIMNQIHGLTVNESVNYAPASGNMDLRIKWKEEMLRKNPSLKNKNTSLPVVTNALTHGLSLSADLFVDRGDDVIVPDKIWGNYNLIFKTKYEANMNVYPFFHKGGYNLTGLQDTLNSIKRDKIIILLNFPNNPTGYSILKKEAEELVKNLKEKLDEGRKIVLLSDDAYFGMFYLDNVLKESIFSKFADLHPNLLAIKIDGATKEDFVWGLRVGFITYSAGNTPKEVYDCIEQKTMGAIRSNISNCSGLSQSIVLKSLNSQTVQQERAEKIAILEKRAKKVIEVNKNEEYMIKWEPYPFNSGYFMCMKLKTVNAENLRKHLLKKYGLGVIAIDDTDIRVAFSCLEEVEIPEVYEIIYKGILDIE
ncbi:MAG: aminotransferase class I/II-fold pyridoxal phosphate-dependent enzyme [Candidatus Lokiarchaeota archaeon]|nr:aminotransferase class I/II-fold pyridoxal phosphate-dependent enzyme [Candidatus Lokiarchaeota archaeon]